jgi:hypothetical protein
MQYDDLPESGNVEDRRGQGGGFGGGGFGMPGAGGLSIGTIVVLGLLGWALGIDPSYLIGGAEIFSRNEPRVETPSQPGRTGAPTDESGRFVSRILGSTEAVWRDVFSKDGKTYTPPVLVLYNGQTRSQCGGQAQAAMGPFYCPSDRKVYLDTSFFKQIETRFHGCDGTACQFSQAYVIAHEVGHHVQNLLGILGKATSAENAAGSRAGANHIQVEVELQADCFAGLWAKRENDLLISQGKRAMIEPGDVEAALRTAAAIGDDTLQKRSQGYAVPDSFTHGTSAQRQRWFETGFRNGTVASCNTFAAQQL